MARAYRIRSGHTTASLNANAVLVQSLLSQLLDAQPSGDVVALTLDLNGHDLINLGPVEDDAGIKLKD